MVERDASRIRLQEAFVLLSRHASLAGRAGILVLDEDLSALDRVARSRAESHDLIGGLERDGRVRRVRRGVYVLVDSTGRVNAGLLDVVAALTPAPYLVTGGRALEFHDLTDQHFRRVDVLTKRQLRRWSWRGEEVRYHPTDKPLKHAVRSRRTGARIATTERAIVDSLSHPQWGVTLAQVGEALDTALTRDRTFADSLANEAAVHGSHSLARRLGFLVSRLAGHEAARVFLPLRGNSKASTPLMAGGHSAGRIDSTWQVRENVEVERMLEHREIR